MEDGNQTVLVQDTTFLKKLTSRIVGNLKAEKDQNFKRTSVSVGGYESGSQRDRRSGYSYDEKMEMGAWEYETGASGKHLKSRSDLTVGNDKYAGTSSFRDKTSFELYNESKSRSSKWTSIRDT